MRRRRRLRLAPALATALLVGCCRCLLCPPPSSARPFGSTTVTSGRRRSGGGGGPSFLASPPRRPPTGGRRTPAALVVPASPMEIWLDARSSAPGVEDDDESSSAARRDRDRAAARRRIAEADAVILSKSSPRDLVSPPTDGNVSVYTQRGDELRGGSDGGVVVGASVALSDASSVRDAALALIGSVGWILCDGREGAGGSGGSGGPPSDGDESYWRMIPAETLISAAQGTGTRVAMGVDRTGDVVGLSRALELGVDALCVKIDADEDLWDAVKEAREERMISSDMAPADDDLSPTICSGTRQRLETSTGKGALLADRVCVDLVQTLKPTEGCWVGSSAKLTALVLSEAATSSYVPSRPFRVNAGPVHSYIVLGDGKTTKYLSELKAGDEVLVFDAQTGKEKSVAVGRLKTEVRPCIIVGLSVDEGEDKTRAEGQVFLQQAETVRLGQRRGEESFVRVTDLSKGTEEEVLLRVASRGTHVGNAYSGQVAER